MGWKPRIGIQTKPSGITVKLQTASNYEGCSRKQPSNIAGGDSEELWRAQRSWAARDVSSSATSAGQVRRRPWRFNGAMALQASGSTLQQEPKGAKSECYLIVLKGTSGGELLAGLLLTFLDYKGVQRFITSLKALQIWTGKRPVHCCLHFWSPRLCFSFQRNAGPAAEEMTIRRGKKHRSVTSTHAAHWKTLFSAYKQHHSCYVDPCPAQPPFLANISTSILSSGGRQTLSREIHTSVPVVRFQEAHVLSDKIPPLLPSSHTFSLMQKESGLCSADPSLQWLAGLGGEGKLPQTQDVSKHLNSR